MIFHQNVPKAAFLKPLKFSLSQLHAKAECQSGAGHELTTQMQAAFSGPTVESVYEDGRGQQQGLEQQVCKLTSRCARPAGSYSKSSGVAERGLDRSSKFGV